MRHHVRNTGANEMMGGSRMILNNGSDGTFVDGAELKPADTPVETLIGFANGAVSGAILGAIVSAVVTASKHGRESLGQFFSSNLTGKHLPGFLAGVVGLGALGALSRNSKSRMQNQWRAEHYEFLEREADAAREPQHHSGKSWAKREDERAQAEEVSAGHER